MLVQGPAPQGGAPARPRAARAAAPRPWSTVTTRVSPSLWDGKTLANWEGETDVWSIDNGAIHADTTKTPGQHHLHYKGPGP